MTSALADARARPGGMLAVRVRHRSVSIGTDPYHPDRTSSARLARVPQISEVAPTAGAGC
jgi:hypothetical protein